jgi:hypothetical protein
MHQIWSGIILPLRKPAVCLTLAGICNKGALPSS